MSWSFAISAQEMIKFLGKKWLEREKSTYLRKTFSLKKRREFSIKGAKHFLCIQMNSIGDAIMTQPAWATLRSFLPEATIDLICRPHIAPLFANDPAINSIFPFESHKYRPWLFKDINRLERIYLEQKYDSLIDFSALPLSAAACARESAPPSIGFRRVIGAPLEEIDIGFAYDRSFSYSEKAPLRDLMIKMVSPWSKVYLKKRFPTLSLNDDAIQKAQTLLRKKGVEAKGFIVLHPGAKWPPRRWPIYYWRDLIKWLRANLPLALLVLGGEQDKNVVYEILNGSSDSHVFPVISDHIGLSSAIIKMSWLCICNDSAAMHIAAAVGTGSISIFGPGAPERTAPSKEEGCTILYDKMFCSPCNQYYSRERCRRGINFCMWAVKPEIIYRKIKEITLQTV